MPQPLFPAFPKRTSRWLSGAAAVLLVFAPAVSHGVKGESVVHETYRDFVAGDLTDVSLHRDGRLTLAPRASEVAKLADGVIWSVAAGPGGSVFIGAGNEGTVYRLSAGGDLEEWFTTEEILTRAMAVDDEGRLYVGTSPDGKVYRYDGEGEPEEYFNPREGYIWALLFGPTGDLFVATGDEGRLYRVPAGSEAGAKGDVYFDSEESHISTLSWDKQGRLLAGTSPNGYVYRLTGPEAAFALFNSPDEEIRQVLAGDEGELYVATFSAAPGSGNGGTKSSAAVSQALAALASSESDGDEEENESSSDRSRNGKRLSTLYRVDAEGFYEPFWARSGVAIHSLLKLDGGPLLIGTGEDGRLFSLDGFQSWKLQQTLPAGSDIAVLLPRAGTDVLAFTSNPARIYRLDLELSGKGEYLSEVFDAEQVARWGRLYAETTGGSDVEDFQVAVRSGNTEKADGTWTSWQRVDENGYGGADLAPARYFQYRLSFAGPGAEVRRVRFFFRHANAAPVIQALRVITANVGLEKFELPPQQPSIDLDQLFRESRSRSGDSSEPRQQLRAYERPGTVTVAWQARDPNGDELVFSVKMRRAGADAWDTIADEVEDSFYSFGGNGIPEGQYEVKVVASDRPSNTSGEAREATHESEVFTIDNTAPEIRVEQVRVDGSAAILSFRAIDGISTVVAAESLLDGSTPSAVFPEDGIFDAKEEAFEFELEKLSPGRHTLFLHVEDEARNRRTEKVTLEVEDD